MAEPSTKQLLQRLIAELADDCTFEDVMYRLYLLDAVQRGKADIAAGRVVSQEEVERQLALRRGPARAK